MTREAGLRPHWFYTTRQEETRGLDRADVVLAIQPGEARDFAARCRARVEMIEYAQAPRPAAPRAAGRAVVGYFGSGNPWNVAGVRALDSLLAGCAGFADTRFLLLGGITGSVGPLRAFQPGGRVADVADAYAEIDLVVNPMVGGTGLKIKTVEALAHGRAILATADGGAGLEACGDDIRLADLDALVARLAAIVARPCGIADLAREQTRRYAAFQADVAVRLEALVDGWAEGRS